MGDMKLGAVVALAALALLLGPSEGRIPQRPRFLSAPGEFTVPFPGQNTDGLEAVLLFHSSGSVSDLVLLSSIIPSQ